MLEEKLEVGDTIKVKLKVKFSRNCEDENMLLDKDKYARAEKVVLNINDALHFLERIKAHNMLVEYVNINEVEACLCRIRDYTGVEK